MSWTAGPTETATRLEERLSAPRWAGTFPGPDFAGRSLPNLGVSALLRSGGTPGKELLPPLDKVYGVVPEEGSTSVVFLLDGFGWNTFRTFLQRARSGLERRFAAAIAPRTLPLSSVFPSTTSSALLSLSSGVAPGTHGIVGYTEYFPAWGAVLNTLKWSPPWGGPRDLAIGKPFQPRDLFPLPTLFRRGVSSAALTKETFEGSAFTRMLYDGAKFEGYVSLSDLSHHLARLLARPRDRRPALLWVYWDLLDAVGHVNGPLPELLVAEIAHVLLALSSSAARLPAAAREGVQLFLTGDHGQVPVTPEKAWAAHGDEGLMALLQRPPAGERRAAFLQARPGQRDQLGSYLDEHLPPGWKVLPVPATIEGGLFGPAPHHPELSARLGDFLVLPPEGCTMWYRPPGARAPEERFLLGTHGGLTPEELLVALLSVPFEELARWDA